MSRTRFAAVFGLFTLLLAVTAVSGGPPVADEVIVAGFAPHIQPCHAGQIDWTGGFIIAEGRGIAESADQQGQLLAQRAATLDAAACALAIAAGINVDAHGRAGDVRDGRVMIEGVIKGHEEVEAAWRPDLRPPEMRVRLRVPLWGVKSVSAVFYDLHCQHVSRSGARRVPLVTDRVDVSDRVLVIDARGTGTQASLFPIVVTQGGDLLYDVGRLPAESARGRPPARFVETEMTFEQLRAWATLPHVRLASYTEPGAGAPPTTQPPATQPATTQPSSQPGEESRRRERRRVVIKAVAAGGEQPARIVVTAEDAEKLRRSAEGASLLSQGQVLIVVDSAAAGIQGRRGPGMGETPVLAHALRP
ncbi:MAG: hypothetical protein V2A79_02930 [Planctomycetota bacterium]